MLISKFFLVLLVSFPKYKSSLSSLSIWSYGGRLFLTGRSGFDSRRGLGIFLFFTASRPALEPIQWVSGALYPRAKRPGREADHSHHFSAEVKNAWCYISAPFVFMVWCLVKHRNNFILPYVLVWIFIRPFSWFHHCSRKHWRPAFCVSCPMLIPCIAWSGHKDKFCEHN
jgi:hypothetical protein